MFAFYFNPLLVILFFVDAATMEQLAALETKMNYIDETKGP